MSRSDRTEVAVGEGVADVIELRVVEGVEELRTKFKPAATRLAEHEALEEREVPVLAARTTKLLNGRLPKVSSHSWGEC